MSTNYGGDSGAGELIDYQVDKRAKAIANYNSSKHPILDLG